MRQSGGEYHGQQPFHGQQYHNPQQGGPRGQHHGGFQAQHQGGPPFHGRQDRYYDHQDRFQQPDAYHGQQQGQQQDIYHGGFQDQQQDGYHGGLQGQQQVVYQGQQQVVYQQPGGHAGQRYQQGQQPGGQLGQRHQQGQQQVVYQGQQPGGHPGQQGPQAVGWSQPPPGLHDRRAVGPCDAAHPAAAAPGYGRAQDCVGMERQHPQAFPPAFVGRQGGSPARMHDHGYHDSPPARARDHPPASTPGWAQDMLGPPSSREESDVRELLMGIGVTEDGIAQLQEEGMLDWKVLLGEQPMRIEYLEPFIGLGRALKAQRLLYSLSGKHEFDGQLRSFPEFLRQNGDLPAALVQWEKGRRVPENTEFPVRPGRRSVLSAALRHGVALLKNGRAVTWGGPAAVCMVPEFAVPVRSVHAGLKHSAAVLANGSLVVWGEGEVEARNKRLGGLKNVISYSASPDRDFAVAVTEGGRVYGLGPLAEGMVEQAGCEATAVTCGSDFCVVSYGDDAAVLRIHGSCSTVTVPQHSGILGVTACYTQCFFVYEDRVICTGDQSAPQDLGRVVQCCGGIGVSAALSEDGTVRVWGADAEELRIARDDLAAIAMFPKALVGVTNKGELVTKGYNLNGCCSAHYVGIANPVQ
eukprot:TRINITY_DN567_c0_g1_i2.p1 TRINITY_DN567_c0_g1~~TRINITY_DN567_c0_g1_i2.p1  ORF type:complete len:636 (+),score=79.38 TRINITY_DN567_c0_g1_i2:56-1963(+)